MGEQLPLFGKHRGSILERFNAFDAANPHVWKQFEKRALSRTGTLVDVVAEAVDAHTPDDLRRVQEGLVYLLSSNLFIEGARDGERVLEFKGWA